MTILASAACNPWRKRGRWLRKRPDEACAEVLQNCPEARAAGPSPIRKGEAGYVELLRRRCGRHGLRIHPSNNPSSPRCAWDDAAYGCMWRTNRSAVRYRRHRGRSPRWGNHDRHYWPLVGLQRTSAPGLRFCVTGPTRGGSPLRKQLVVELAGNGVWVVNDVNAAQQVEGRTHPAAIMDPLGGLQPAGTLGASSSAHLPMDSPWLSRQIHRLSICFVLRMLAL